jgi:hypothetical protein
MPKDILVDTRVHDLALFWLSDDDTAHAKDSAPHDARVMSLAADIQRAIEDWCEDEAQYNAQLDEQATEASALKGYTDAERERI